MDIIESNGQLFQLVRAINKDIFKTKDDIKLYKDYIFTDTVKQHQNKYLFCRAIDDVEFEEIEEEN